MKMTIILVFILILTLVLASVTVILSGLTVVSDTAYSVPAVEEGLRSNSRAWVGRVISIRGTVTNARSICAGGRSCAIPHWAVDPGCHAPCTVASWEEVGQVVSVPVPPLRKTAPWWTIYVGGRYGGRQFIPVARLILQPSSRPLPSSSPPSFTSRARALFYWVPYFDKVLLPAPPEITIEITIRVRLLTPSRCRLPPQAPPLVPACAQGIRI